MSRQNQMYNCVKSQLRNDGWKALIIIGDCAILDHSVSLFSWCIAEELKFIFRQNKCLQSGMIQIQFFNWNVFSMQVYFSWSGELDKPKNYTSNIKFG